ncbi:MAG TPA: homoserine kinase, partial [Stenotrophomonas sp.]|nr:homoserine kinase [Stenotrophomonas sp.]
DRARAAAAPVRAAFAAAGLDSEAWVSPLDAPGAHLC